MATYKTYAELKNKTLNEDDIVILKGYKYKVLCSFLSEMTGCNHLIFNQLEIDKNKVAESCYGYKPIGGDWPECKRADYGALTRLVLHLFKKIEDSQIESPQRTCYIITWEFANAHAEQLREYFATTEIVNRNRFDCQDHDYYWYSDEKIVHWGNPLTSSDVKVVIVDDELYRKLIKPNLKSTTNENRFQNKKPQISRGTVPGGSIIRGRKSKTSVELGHLSYRTVSCE